MTKELEIKENLESRVFQGMYRPGLIRIRPNMTVQEKSITLKHELTHHHFYTETLTGRLCACFFNPRFTVTYLVFMFLAWLFFPFFYVVLLLLPVVDRVHELLVSVKYPSRISFSLSVLVIFALLALFRLRLGV